MLHRLNENPHFDICVYDNNLYAAPYCEGDCYFIVVFSTETWQGFTVFPTDCAGDCYKHTLCVNKRHLFVTCEKSHRVYKMSLDGKIIDIYSQNGHSKGDCLEPVACMTDDDDNLLIVNGTTQRLQLLHGTKWCQVDLTYSKAQAAVYDGHALFVIDKQIDGGQHRMLKYE